MQQHGSFASPADLEPSSLIGSDGRVVLTPTYLTDAATYGQVATPTLRPDTSFKRERSIPVMDHHSDQVLFALCLMVAVGVRANLVSLFYLLVFCYGVVHSFQSRLITLVTLGVALLACICHGAVMGAFKNEDDYEGADVAALVGFIPMHSSKKYLLTFGVDIMVLVCSTIHYWYVLRRLNTRSREQEEEERARQHFDLFEMGEQLMNHSEPKRDRKQSMLKAVEILSSVLLLLTSVSVPAFASGTLYLVLLTRLIGYTIFVHKVNVQDLVTHKHSGQSPSYFLGPAVTRVLLGLCLVIIVAWYAFHLTQVTSGDTVQTIGHYAGFVDFRDGGVKWEYYFFAAFLFLLFVSCAKLHNLHAEAKEASTRPRGSLVSGFSLEANTVDLGSVNADVAQSLLNSPNQRNRGQTTDLKDLLAKQSIVVRAFARDGGLLLGSAAAIIWCVSYPSYLSAPFLALAFVTIALFGLLSSSIFMWLLITYGTGLALAEYTSNLTINFIPEDYTTYGLRVFDYPFLDLGVHTLCLVFIFLAIRTQWRYQDILRESRRRRNTAMPDGGDANDVTDGCKTSFTNFAKLAKLRNQLQLGWKAVARLWLVDAKRVIFTHLDALVLATILVVALSTHVSFLQIGYLVLAALLMLFFEKRRRFWRVLLTYSLGACFAVFLRNIDCTQSDQMDLIGLQCYHPGLYTWGSLWPTLFSAQLLIIFQLVFQLVIYVANNEAIEERLRTREHVRQNPAFFVSRLAVEIDNWFRICGVLLCYIAFIVVALQFETGTTSLTQDFGLEYHASTDGISDVFVYLLPTAVMTALCFWQLSSMMKEIVLATALVIVTMWVALDEISFVGWLYIVVLIVGRAMSESWKQLWFPLFWLAALAMVLKFLIQLNTFDTQEASSANGNVLFKAGDDSDWVGMIRLNERYEATVGKSALWELLSGEFLIILMCALQRMAQYFDSSSTAGRQAELDELTARFEEHYALYASKNLDGYHPTSSCEVDDDDDDLKDRARAFTYDEADIPSLRSKGNQAASDSEPESNRTEHSAGSAVAAQDRDFLSCLRDFGTTYASKASVNVVMLLLTISCFVHQDFIAIVYMMIVYSMMYAASTTVCRRRWALAWLLSLCEILMAPAYETVFAVLVSEQNRATLRREEIVRDYYRRRTEQCRGDVKYVFQSELSKEFNTFLSALAFAVPREALDDSIIECLKERGLPNPMDVAPPSRNTGEEDANYDENKSEWSSVTGDESTLGDPEDEEFDDKKEFSWRAPLYQFLYNFQNAGFRLESTLYEEDDMNEPSLAEIGQLVINGGDMLNMVYVLAAFGFLIIENPRPSPTVWTHLLAYRELRLQGFWVEAHSDDIMDDQASSRMENTEIGSEVAAQVLEELRLQEKMDEEKKAKESALAAVRRSEDNVAHSPSVHRTKDYNDPTDSSRLPRSPRTDKDNVVSKQMDMDADESEVGFRARAKESWLEKKLPKAHAYFQTVICKPPAQWDKDIHAAIAGEKPGRDFYTASLSVLLLSSIYAVIFYEELGEADSSSTSVADANSRVSSSSLLSGYLVLLVLIELIFIIWDRVAYVCASLRSKVILQYLYAFTLHMTVWYFLPNNTNIYFQQRPALVAFYLFQCVYLWLGALQIRYGYPAYLGSRYNYTEETKMTAVSEMLFGLMMQAPFLFEMRALLDYMCTKTSLSWQHWILLEDTAAHLFSVKGEMRGRVEEAEVLQGKKRQPMTKKLTSAGVMLLFLLICLVGPLAMFSSINPSTTANDVTLSTVVFGIVDEQATMNQLYSNSDSNSPSCKVNLNTESASVQCVEFDVFSYDVWDLSPPRMDLLVTQLQSTEVLNWTVTLSFTRPGPTNSEVISTTYSVEMTDDHRNALIPMIKQTVNSGDDKTLTAIQVDNLFPAVLQLTASSGVLRRSTEMRSVAVTKHSSDGSTWWTIEPVLHSSNTNYCSAAYPFCIVAVSDRIVQGLTTLGISSYGLTAVYIFVVVTVGSAVKGFFRGKLLEIQYAELPDPEDVLELVEGIYIARQEHYVGHLKDEVRIFETLVRVLRSPETLIKVTGTNVIHIPTAKEKLD
ncbi:hypothetical protein BBO99_00009087 [Phytophthora kernoviae]|uniref:Uncharacterized protein n=1 Tax=Phytophthora kernoviae TaxID=325452 RepID=A0A3R7J1Z0_9STRA|nr:hypothetical protein BBI17_009102 [Phytophthora kernoviae]RLN74127.1 hypothetical protein BBO99_00009087 [Phytophthora kernoviae]